MSKIVSVETFPVRIPREEAYLGKLPEEVVSAGYFQRPPYRALYSRHFETVFVKLTTDDGAVGWGEALAPVAPEVAATIIMQLLTPVLVGANPFASDYLWMTMYDLMRERGYYSGFMLDAISAVDIALWDLKGKLLDQPLYQLLGGLFRETVPCYVSGLPAPDDVGRIQLAREWIDKGFRAFKLALGHGVQTDIKTMTALRAALGGDIRLFIDVHWVYSLDEAVTLGQGLAALGVEFLEAPINPEDIDAHAMLTRAINIPVAIGETERTRYQFKNWLVQRGADILQPDIGRAGVSELMHIAHMAEAFNIPVAPHLSVGQSPSIAASIHVAASIPNLFILEYQPPVFELANTFLKTPLVCADGQFHLPQGPGLGIALDEEKIRRLM